MSNSLGSQTKTDSAITTEIKVGSKVRLTLESATERNKHLYKSGLEEPQLQENTTYQVARLFLVQGQGNYLFLEEFPPLKIDLDSSSQPRAMFPESWFELVK